MRSTWRFPAAAALLLLALTAPVRGQSFGFPWWRDAQFQRDLSLTADQSGKIDAVFQKTIPTLREKRTELDAQEEELSRMIAANADEASVIKQVDRVEAIRSHMNKMRTLMLLRMRQILSPEQRLKLNQKYEQWEKDHRRDGRGKH
jgi:Spy/CpxP family protein refolding chaperone